MQLSAEVIEWHICETLPAETPKNSIQAIHMGPFATEQECRAVLASLTGIPGFNQRDLEVRPQARRREKRLRIKLPIQVYRLSAPDKSWDAHTIDISGLGARLIDPTHDLRVGEFLDVRYGHREAVFRVAWIGAPGSSSANQLGVECLTPEANIWGLDFSNRTDDEPLLQEIVGAGVVQRQLFPREKPILRTLDYSGKCIQARTVGGDYYDFLDMGPGRVGFVLADVAGKGVAAALLMANLQGSIHNRPVEIADLPSLLSSVNLHLYKHTEPDRYATLFFGCYDDQARSVAYVNCGHSPALLLRENGNVERLQATATVLGLFGNWECSVAQTRMDSGDVLSIFTDGLTETTASNGDEFGESRLLGVLQDSRKLASADILHNVEQAVQQFRSSDQLQDDVTLVVARAQ